MVMEVTVNPSGASTEVRPKTHFAWWQRIRWSEHAAGYFYLLPALIIFGLFAWYPIVRTVIFSFQNVSLTGESTWIGLDNFNRMLADPDFLQAWRNSIVFASLSLAMGFFIPVFLSIMVNEMRHA